MSKPLSKAWAPHPGLVLVAWMLTTMAAIWIALVNDNQGRLLVGCAGIVLLATSLYGTLIRPRLAADAQGITVRGLGGKKVWTWSDADYRVNRVTRFGRTVATLELGSRSTDDLLTLGQLDLGAQPTEVFDELRSLNNDAKPPGS